MSGAPDPDTLRRQPPGGGHKAEFRSRGLSRRGQSVDGVRVWGTPASMRNPARDLSGIIMRGVRWQMPVGACPWPCARVPCTPKASVTQNASKWETSCSSQGSWGLMRLWLLGRGSQELGSWPWAKWPVQERTGAWAWKSCHSPVVSLSKLHLSLCPFCGCSPIDAFLLSFLSERFPNEDVPRGVKLWTCHVDGLDTTRWLWWKRYRATSKTGPREPLQPPASDSVQIVYFIRVAEALLRDRLPWTAPDLRGSGSLQRKWGQGSLWHPPFCAGRQPYPCCPCSPELRARLPLCLLPCLTCWERPVCIPLALSVSSLLCLDQYHPMLILGAYSASSPCWEEASFLQLQTASSWSGPKLWKKIYILSDTIEQGLMRCFCGKGWTERERQRQVWAGLFNIFSYVHFVMRVASEIDVLFWKWIKVAFLVMRARCVFLPHPQLWFVLIKLRFLAAELWPCRASS